MAYKYLPSGDFFVFKNMSATAEILGGSRGRVTCPIDVQTTRKVNVRAIAKEYETIGIPVDPTPEALADRYRDDPELRSIDTYALGVPVARDIVRSADEKRLRRPPYGLIQRRGDESSVLEHLMSGAPFDHVRGAMYATLSHEADDYFRPENLEAMFDKDPVAEHNHTVFSMLTQDRREIGDDAQEFIENGLSTGTNVLPRYGRLVPVLHKRQYHRPPDPEEAGQILEDNERFVSRLAVAHLVVFSRITEKSGGTKKRDFDPGDFQYTPTDRTRSGLSLGFTNETEEHVRKTAGAWLSDPVKGRRLRMGCIAAHSDALQTLTSWNGEIMTSIYRQTPPGRW